MRIIIEGNPGEGKTTVACMIYGLLRDAGFEITKLDDPDLPLSDERIVQQRIEGLKSGPGIKIEIETRYTPRSRR